VVPYTYHAKSTSESGTKTGENNIHITQSQNPKLEMGDVFAFNANRTIKNEEEKRDIKRESNTENKRT
jgi:hypothetical protein